MHNFDNISFDIFFMGRETDYDILEIWSVHQDLKLFSCLQKTCLYRKIIYWLYGQPSHVGM